MDAFYISPPILGNSSRSFITPNALLAPPSVRLARWQAPAFSRRRTGRIQRSTVSRNRPVVFMTQKNNDKESNEKDQEDDDTKGANKSPGFDEALDRPPVSSDPATPSSLSDEIFKFDVLRHRISEIQDEMVDLDRKTAFNWKKGIWKTKTLATLGNDYVRKVKFSLTTAHSGLVAFGGYSGRVYVFDMFSKSSRPMAEFRANFEPDLAGISPNHADLGMANETTSVDFDGSVILSGARNGSVVFSNLRTRIERKIMAHSGAVTGAKLIPSQGLAITCADASENVNGVSEPTLVVWNSKTMQILQRIILPDWPLSMHADENYIFVGCRNGRVYIYKTSFYEKMMEATKHHTISPAKRALVTLPAPPPLMSLEAHQSSKVTAIHVYNNTKMVTAASSGEIKVWDLNAGGAAIMMFMGHDAAVVSVQMDDSKVVSASRDGLISVWPLAIASSSSSSISTTSLSDSSTSLNPSTVTDGEAVKLASTSKDNAKSAIRPMFSFRTDSSYVTTVQFENSILVSDGMNNQLTMRDFAPREGSE